MIFPPTLAAARAQGRAAADRTRVSWHLRHVRAVGPGAQIGGKPDITASDLVAGEQFRVWSGHRQTLICGWGKIRIGDRVFLNSGVVLFSVVAITIGDDVALAGEVYVMDSSSHGIEGRPIHEAAVTIGRGSWIGARSIILPGVTIGERVVVAAGSVVTKDVPDDTLVGGNPARVIRSLVYPDHCQRAWCDWACSCPGRGMGPRPTAPPLPSSYVPAGPADLDLTEPDLTGRDPAEPDPVDPAGAEPLPPVVVLPTAPVAAAPTPQR